MFTSEQLKTALWRHQYSALALFAVLMALFFPVAKAPRNIAAVALILFAVMTAVVLKPRLKIFSVDLLAFLLVFGMPVLWFFHPGPGPYGAYAKDAVFALDMLALLFCLQVRPDITRTVIHAIIIGVVFTACLSIFQYAGFIPMRDAGVTLGLLNGTLRGAFSLLLVFTIGICSFMIRNSIDYKIVLFCLLAIIVCLADLLFVVAGRSGYLALAVVGPYVVYNLYLKNKVVIVIILFVISAGLVASPTLGNRVTAARSDLAGYSQGAVTTPIGARFEMWKVSWDLFKSQPFFGAGTNGFKVRWDRDGREKTAHAIDNPHSTYFYVLANYGFAGMGLLLFLLWRMARFSWLQRNNLFGAAIFCYLIVFMVGSLTNTMLTSSFYLSWLAIMGAIMAGTPESSASGVVDGAQ